MGFVKDQKELYAPKARPELVTVPPMRFIMVDGVGDPNAEDGDYHRALGILYALSYTIKMSKLGAYHPEGYFEYSVAPLEGLWQMADGSAGVDYTRKRDFAWTAMIRQPDFVTEEVFAWAREEAALKKKLDSSPARLEIYDEGLCVHCMHLGPYDDEPATLEAMHAFIAAQGLELDMDGARRHHEIYLKDPRRTAPDKLKTILRLPVRGRS